MSDGFSLSVSNISKHFPGVVALDKVSIGFRGGEIHALMGENGAGKSTLIKLLTGVLQPDSGEIALGGKLIRPKSPEDAAALGVSAVFQEINLLPNLSVGENICLGRESHGWFGIRWKDLHTRAAKALAELGLNISTKANLGSLSIAERQMIAIARALDVSCSVLILDEPTSSLDRAEVVRLFNAIRKLKDRGTCIIFVTHFMDQMFEVSDRVSVLRNGTLVCSTRVCDITRRELVNAMIGSEAKFEKSTPTQDRQASGEPLIVAKRLGKHKSVENVSLEMRPGEILGFAGLLGSGRTEALRILFGLDKHDQGELTVDGRRTHKMTPSASIKVGIGLCPEDRKSEAVFPNLKLKENIALVAQLRQGWLKKISAKRQDELAQRYVKQFGISTRSVDTPIGQLSGGNQQKAILSRWLAISPRVLLLDEPTRGIDIGAKAEIEASLNSFQMNGMSVLFVASEIEEVVRVCGKVAVFRDRKMVETIAGSDLNEARVLDSIAERSA